MALLVQEVRKSRPHFYRPVPSYDKIVRLAYWLDLPKELSQIHNTFHVSQLRKCVIDKSVVVPLDDIQVDDRMTKTLWSKVLGLVKVQWQHLSDS